MNYVWLLVIAEKHCIGLHRRISIVNDLDLAHDLIIVDESIHKPHLVTIETENIVDRGKSNVD